MSRRLLIGVAAGALIAFGGGGVAAYLYHSSVGQAAAPPRPTATKAKAEAPAAPPTARSTSAGAAAPADGQGKAEGPGPENAAARAAAPGSAPTLPVGATAPGGDAGAPGAPLGPAPAGRNADKAGSRSSEERSLGQLVRLYEAMPPKDAASVVNRLDPELSTTILLGMRERQAAKVLGLLPPDKAADLTMRIARTRGTPPPTGKQGSKP